MLAFTPTFAADTAPLAAEENVRIEIRADKRTGRLVRRVIVEPAVLVGKPVAPSAPNSPAVGPVPLAKDRRINQAVEQAAKQYDLDPLLVHAVIQVESGYNQFAISPVGAQGLMQLMPATAKSLGVRNSFDVEENIRAGVRHLKELKNTYKDDRLALAAYNAGAGAVNKYQWIPPYAETQEYVYKVGKKYGEARRAAAKTVVAETAPVAPKQNESSVEEAQTRPVEAYVDAEGRLHMRTK
ncbi:MAG TPA: lytic transglycosylase domain-containing protein [Bryobacteraceae bacterium]|nr:lytic transglycosylase domain-containing protein [Bryobacteraceae bacterium]